MKKHPINKSNIIFGIVLILGMSICSKLSCQSSIQFMYNCHFEDVQREYESQLIVVSKDSADYVLNGSIDPDAFNRLASVFSGSFKNTIYFKVNSLDSLISMVEKIEPKRVIIEGICK